MSRPVVRFVRTKFARQVWLGDEYLGIVARGGRSEWLAYPPGRSVPVGTFRTRADAGRFLEDSR